MIAPTFGKGEEMKITAGFISQVRPGWGLQTGTVTSLMAIDADGHPEVLAAQMICNAAISGVKVLMLLPARRDDDDVWGSVVRLLAGNDSKSAGQELGNLPLAMHTFGTGWDRSGGAQLVYAPKVSGRQLRRFEGPDAPAILVVGQNLDDRSPFRVRNETIRVSGDALVVDGEGFEVPVVYDPSGPLYRPA